MPLIAWIFKGLLINFRRKNKGFEGKCLVSLFLSLKARSISLVLVFFNRRLKPCNLDSRQSHLR